MSQEEDDKSTTEESKTELLSENEDKEECAMIAQDSPTSEEGTATFGPQSSDQDIYDQNNYKNLLKVEQVQIMN